MIIIVPSRGRPSRAAGMVASIQETAEDPVRIIVAVDPDDPELGEYRRLVHDLVVLPDRLGYGGTLNHIARAEWDNHDVIGAFGDDVVFRTPGWDRAVAQALSRPGIAYPNDLAHGEVHATAVFMSSAVAKALGWLAYPGCWHQYVDNVWMEVGRTAGVLTYLPNVIVEHLHPAYGKAEDDDTYRSVYSQPQAGLDHAAFLNWKANDMLVDARKIRAIR